MINSTTALRLALASPLVLLTACGSMIGREEVQTNVDELSLRAKSITDQTVTNTVARIPSIEKQQEVAAPWLAGKSVALAKEVTIAPVLKRRLNLADGAGLDALGKTRITALSAECNPASYTITRLASCVTAYTGLPVRVRPDALLPAASFAMRSGSVGAAASGPASASPNSGTAPSPTLTVAPVDMQLSTLLDMASAAWAVKYRLADDGAIEIYRTETKVLRLKALAQKVTNSVTSNTGFAAESKTTFDNTATDVLASMRASLLALGTLGGALDINADSKAVIVTDTPEAIARIETYLESENKRLARRVTLVVEELFVTNKNGREASIDWNALYNEVNAGFTLTSPAALVGANVGQLGFTAVNGSGKGSTLFLKALDQMGLSATRRSYPLSTTNGNSVTIGLPTIFDYVSSVSSSAVSSTTGTVSAPTIVQKEDKYGAFLTVTPEAQDDGQILLSVNLADRSGTLTPYTVVVQGSGTTVQQRNIQEANLTTRTVMRSGTTHLIGGLDESQSDSTKRRVDADAPMLLGGSDSINLNRRRIILLVTAIIEDNI